MAKSPYKDKNQDEWKKITEELVSNYPLSLNEILEISIISWRKLWTTKVGNTIELKEVDLPATVVGYFFQKIYTHELNKRYPKIWKGESEKSDKDIVNIQDNIFSTEMKSSGQLGYKVFGNRSYCQKSDTPSKAKSGYYITVNFYKQQLTLISLGWIEQDDWKCQGAESGQAATLPLEVYKYKLIPIYGSYQLMNPIGLLKGVGPGKIQELNEEGIFTFQDILTKYDKNAKIQIVYNNNKDLLAPLKEFI